MFLIFNYFIKYNLLSEDFMLFDNGKEIRTHKYTFTEL